METAYLHDLHTEDLQPGQEPVQRGLIPERAVQDCLDRLNRGAEQLEVKEGFGRRDPDDADLVVRRWQQSPPGVAMDMGQIPHALASWRAARHAPRVIVTLVRFLRG
jgi:hypothetical protein